MIESAHSPTSSTDRVLLSVLFVSVIVAAAYVSLAVVGGRVFPAPINDLIFLTLGTGIVVLTTLRVGGQLERRLERVDRHLIAVHSALVRHGVQLAEVTGEIPRITTAQPSPGPRDSELDGYAQGYADGLARKPLIGKVVPFNRSQGS